MWTLFLTFYICVYVHKQVLKMFSQYVKFVIFVLIYKVLIYSQQIKWKTPSQVFINDNDQMKTW